MVAALEKLMIGTAQFGQEYGVTNINGKVLQKEAGLILDLARNNKIRNLDTARSYGDSESILGKIGVEDFEVCTKLPSIRVGASQISNFCHNCLRDSMANLKVESVDTVLLHRPEELLSEQGGAIYKALCVFKDQGLVKNIGVSIYSPDTLKRIIPKYEFDAVQVPLNLFDRRIIDSGWSDRLASMGVKIFARSVFLQGILLSDLESLPKYFWKWSSEFRELSNFCKSNSLSKLEACLNFVIQTPEISKVLVGVETRRQLSDIIAACQNPRQLESSFLESHDLGLINPVEWEL